MKKVLIVSILVACLAIGTWVFAKTNPYILGGGCSFTEEDFSNVAWVEVDEHNEITKTDADTITWVQLDRDATSYVYKDFTASYFDGDLTARFSCQFTNTYMAIIGHFGLFNEVDHLNSIAGDGVSFKHYHDSTTSHFYLTVYENGGSTHDYWDAPVAGITYYITVTRDDDGGANNTGQWNAYIRITNHAGELKDTLTLDCAAGEQNDFQYMYAVQSFDDVNGDRDADGFIDTLEWKECL